jgi:hypothetical protein
MAIEARLCPILFSSFNFYFYQKFSHVDIITKCKLLFSSFRYTTRRRETSLAETNILAGGWTLTDYAGRWSSFSLAADLDVLKLSTPFSIDSGYFAWPSKSRKRFVSIRGKEPIVAVMAKHQYAN